MRVNLRLLPLAAILLAAVGCGGTPTSNKEEKAPATLPAHVKIVGGVKKVATSGLPKLGAPLPPLDLGRLENVAQPEGWETLASDDQFLARFAPTSDATDPPRILFTAEHIPGNFANDVTPENVTAFAKALATEKKDETLVEAVKPMMLGNNAFARYVTAGKQGERDIELQHLVTQYAGRRYTLTLEVLAGEEELLKHRDPAYAVAAGMRFVKPGQAKPANQE